MDWARQCLRFLEESGEIAPTFSWQEPARADFEQAFARIQNMIAQGQIDKAVPVVFARARQAVTPIMKLRWLLEVLAAPDNLHAHGWWDGEQGLLGATPEILFDVQGRALRTMALAGTLAKADGRAEDLARSQKDQYEHRLVVKDIRNELQNIGQVRVGTTEIVDLPTLWHLKTSIEAELHDEPDIEDLIRRLHPTAALGVFPRLFGWRWMRELPGQEGRARYGAPVTWRLGGGRVLSLVGIRHLQWRGDQLLLGSGCGIVKDSDVDAEWTELIRKRQSVLKILGIAT
ncbi:MAG: chorismate-binding protein [Bdellovibrionaceae bacterium]|nr:chorismate-binding protein [Pseudobdellovibrionaceae bacterium]